MTTSQFARTLYFELSEDTQQRSGLSRFVYTTGAPIDLQLFWSAIRIWEVADGQARFLKNGYAPVDDLPDPEELTLVMHSAQQVDVKGLWCYDANDDHITE